MSTTEEIKAKIDIVDLVSETVQLRHSGKNYTGFCPFHENKRTPSFAVFPESGTWRCFGQCNEGGDIFKFVMKKEGWDFAEALQYLAQRAGVQLKPITPQDREQAEEHDRLRRLLEEAVTLYRHHLFNTPPGQQALAYLGKRGLDARSIEVWELGYAPQSWDLVKNHFLPKGYTADELVAAGLLSEREEKTYDRFRHRIMFPIRNDQGKMAGFGARILNPDDIPKFLNSPQTALFDKGGLLYGLDKAAKPIRTKDQAVIVEGYLDVIVAHQYGFDNVISPMGTALGENQLRLLKKRTQRIILALDADAAGDKATLRGLQVARQAMDREGEVAFDARGLIQFESRLQADIRVCTLPPGLDPDEVLHKDPNLFAQLLAEARPVVVHVMETLAKDKDLDDPKVKNQIANQVLPLIEDVPGAIERDTYRQRLARLLRVDERTMVGTGTPTRRPRPLVTSPRGARDAPSDLLQKQSYQESIRLQEEHCLGVLFRSPQLVYRLDRALQQAELSRLSTEDFRDTDHQVLFQIILNALDQDFSRPSSVIISSLPLSLMELADRIFKQTEKLDLLEDRLLEDLYYTAIRLRSLNLRQTIEHLQILMEESQQEGKLLDQDYQRTMVQCSLAKHRLLQAEKRGKDRAVFT